MRFIAEDTLDKDSVQDFKNAFRTKFFFYHYLFRYNYALISFPQRYV